jgi:diaminopimelate dehydrogenase
MKPLQLAVIGFGRLGRACTAAISDDDQLALAGIVRRPESLTGPLPSHFSKFPVVSHARELARVDAALICVPTREVLATARDLLQHRTPIVECTELHDTAFREHRDELDRIASHHKVSAIVGAGWNPGALSLFRALFALLTPRGHTRTSWRTGANLHHTGAACAVPGVREALTSELRSGDGRVQRYVYVELEKGADPARVEAAIRSDPLFLDEETLVFPVEDIRVLEEGHGVLLERCGSAATTDHQMLLLEARYSETALAAAVMTAAARAIRTCKHGASSLFDLPLGSLWGDLKEKVQLEWL